jgi:hypothetical protein
MSAIEGTDSNGEGDIERALAGLELEFLDRYLPYAHPPGGEFRSRDCSSLQNRPGRSVDREYMPVADTVCDGTRCRTRTAPNLQYTDTRAQWQGLHDPGKPRRQFPGHRECQSTCSAVIMLLMAPFMTMVMPMSDIAVSVRSVLDESLETT